MPATLKGPKWRLRRGELAELCNELIQEKRRLESLIERADFALRQAGAERLPADPETHVPAARPSPLDQWKNVVDATKDLRVTNGNLSAERVAKLFGISLSQLATWLGRNKQTVSKTPDADSLQNALEYFERVARLRLVTRNDAEFRKWLRTPHELLDNESPLQVLAKGEWQAMADYVDDALAGAPT